MGIARVKTWQADEALLANDLENEFNNLADNALTEPFSATQSVDLNGHTLTLDANGDTSLNASVDDTVDVIIAGQADFRLTPNTFTALAGSNLVVQNGNISSTIGNLTITNGLTTLAKPGAQTNTVVVPLSVEAATSGSPAAGIGTGLILKSQSADETPSEFAQIQAVAADVTAGSEDTYLEILLRVAGAALNAAYRFVSTGVGLAILTHANTTTRTYTLPNVSGTIIVHGQADVGSADLKTATGSATLTPTGSEGVPTTYSLDVTMNAKSFHPSTTTTGYSETAPPTPIAIGAFGVADPGNAIGRFRVTAFSDGAGAGGPTIVRWEYVTASDRPEMWVVYHPATGAILATWASDDPTPDGQPGVIMAGMTSLRITPKDLESFTALSARASDAAALIQAKRLNPANQAYRALQLMTGDQAPSVWLARNCSISGGKLTATVIGGKA